MTVMRKYGNYRFWFTASLSLILGVGCSDPDKNAARNPGVTPPTVLSVVPASGDNSVCPNAVVTATFSKAMNPATINATTFTVAPGLTGTVTHDASNTTFVFTPSSPLAVATTYTATISTGARDLYGNALANSFVWTFTTAANGCNPPPAVLSVAPISGVTGVCPNAVVTATFSEAMNPATINAMTFTVAPGLAGTVTLDPTGKIATFTPTTSLAVGTVYTATMTTGARDLFGNALPNNVVWSFTTAANGCHPPPVVVSVNPLAAATGVCPNAVVTATFSEAMNPATINAATFTVSGVTGTITHDPSNTIFTFTPSASLAVSTLYTATITIGAQDVFGNALANSFVRNFTTAANGCNPPPVVVSVAPLSGTTAVCPNGVITAAFSEAMNPATINVTTFVVSGGVTGTITHDPTNTIFTYTPSSPLALSTTYTATITTGAKDSFGNALATNFIWSFITAATPCLPTTLPVVVSVTPSGGSAGICPNTVLTATFSKAMDPATINTTTFTVSPGITGTVTLDATGKIATFTPSGSLPLSTVFTVTITVGAKDLSGNALGSNVVSTFTTGASLCQPLLPPISVTPPNGATGVCPNTLVAATFTGAIDASTVNGTTFTLSGPGGVAVGGLVSFDAANHIATFTPTGALALNTTYTATITTGVKDPLGNALASNFVWSFTTAATPCTTPPPPAVISVSPLNSAVGICPNTVITATFNEAMNPVTINTLTFTLLPAVTGAVALDTTGRIATFTPAATLALNTSYTATITTGAQDLAGNPLTANFVWSFTTTTQACQNPVPLGVAGTFEVLAASTVTSTGPTTIAGGDLGLSPGTAVTGFPPGALVTPAAFHITDPTAAQAQLDLTIAYNYAAGLPGAAVLPGELSGLTFTPGLYKTSSTVNLTAGAVTLDAQGNANAVFIFQVGSTLTTLGSTQVILAGGAQAKNIFWQVGSSATLGTNSAFAGNIMALQAITLDTGATLTGRALALNAAVTMDSNIVTAP